MIFLQVDKHKTKSFLKVDFVVFDGVDEACPMYPK